MSLILTTRRMNCFIVIGRSIVPNLLAVVHVYGTERTRIISARKPTKTERRLYESRLGR